MEQSAADRMRMFRTAVDLGGVAAFFVVFLIARLVLHKRGADATVFATWGLVGGSAIALAAGFIVEKRVAPVPLVGGLLALVFGMLTLVFHDPVFVKIKTTIINGVLAAVMLGGLVLRRNPLKAMLSSAVPLTDEGWRQLTLRLGLFYVAMAILNEVVWRTQSEDVWVTFRFPGLWVLTILFMLTQVPMLRKHGVGEAAETASEVEP